MRTLVEFTDAAVEPLFSGLNLTVGPGEFLAILGPNGAGKSTLLNVILGSRKLTAGAMHLNARVGFIPQQRMFPKDLPMRTRDLVSLSLAHGIFRNRRPKRSLVDDALEQVGATGIADRGVGTLSGGQQQLVRQAQALANDPELLLADEPLLSLDVARQQEAVAMMESRRAERETSIMFVTHSVNPVIDHVDRVLYLGPHGHTLGTVDEVMRSEVLSDLYATKVEVVRVGNRLVVI